MDEKFIGKKRIPPWYCCSTHSIFIIFLFFIMTGQIDLIMEALDWSILIGTLTIIVGYGVLENQRKVKTSKTNMYFWWLMKNPMDKPFGLCGYWPTQARWPITFRSTLWFSSFHWRDVGLFQFLFGLPLAMVIICIVFVPLYHKLKYDTAYEFSRSRFWC